MKKLLYYFGTFAVFALFLASCGGPNPTFDESLIPGKWRVGNTQEFYIFNANHTGVNWDESDGGSEQFGTKLNWSLSDSDLTLTFISQTTGQPLVPEIKIVQTLTANSMTFWDSTTGRSTTLNKVE
ncbi:MAG: lipocalin family protein [Bacteroidetes bacterium]|nr:lipocalin family protein [Bacteroidota bacterium]